MSKTQSQLRDDLQGILAERGIHAAAMFGVGRVMCNQGDALDAALARYWVASEALENLIASNDFVTGYPSEDIREKPRKRLYLAGPMRGLPDYNFPAFNEAAERLREQGYDVFNPADGDDPKAPVKPLKEYMKVDLPEVMEADAVVLLDNWWKSEGAWLEVTVALACGIPAVRMPWPRSYKVTTLKEPGYGGKTWTREDLESLEDLWK